MIVYVVQDRDDHSPAAIFFHRSRAEECLLALDPDRRYTSILEYNTVDDPLSEYEKEV